MTGEKGESCLFQSKAITGRALVILDVVEVVCIGRTEGVQVPGSADFDEVRPQPADAVLGDVGQKDVSQGAEEKDDHLVVRDPCKLFDAGPMGITGSAG